MYVLLWCWKGQCNVQYIFMALMLLMLQLVERFFEALRTKQF